MADLFQFGRTILEGIFREKLLGLPLDGDTRTPGFLASWFAGIEWFRPLLGGYAFIAPTAAQTDGPREPPLKGMRPP